MSFIVAGPGVAPSVRAGIGVVAVVHGRVPGQYDASAADFESIAIGTPLSWRGVDAESIVKENPARLSSELARSVPRLELLKRVVETWGSLARPSASFLLGEWTAMDSLHSPSTKE